MSIRISFLSQIFSPSLVNICSAIGKMLMQKKLCRFVIKSISVYPSFEIKILKFVRYCDIYFPNLEDILLPLQSLFKQNFSQICIRSIRNFFLSFTVQRVSRLNIFVLSKESSLFRITNFKFNFHSNLASTKVLYVFFLLRVRSS
jgi:hypothetical protein